MDADHIRWEIRWEPCGACKGCNEQYAKICRGGDEAGEKPSAIDYCPHAKMPAEQKQKKKKPWAPWLPGAKKPDSKKPVKKLTAKAAKAQFWADYRFQEKKKQRDIKRANFFEPNHSEGRKPAPEGYR